MMHSEADLALLSHAERLAALEVAIVDLREQLAELQYVVSEELLAGLVKPAELRQASVELASAMPWVTTRTDSAFAPDFGDLGGKLPYKS